MVIGPPGKAEPAFLRPDSISDFVSFISEHITGLQFYPQQIDACAHNHVSIEKTSRLYQIRCLTRQKLRINFKHQQSGFAFISYSPVVLYEF